MAQYVFRPNDAFSFRERQIIMAKPVANDAISRKVFKSDELVWIDGWVADVMGRPDQWIPIWMTFLGLRTRGLQAKFTRSGGRRGFQYSSKFLALFSGHHTMVFRCIQESNRPALAAELRKHPYDTAVVVRDLGVSLQVTAVSRARNQAGLTWQRHRSIHGKADAAAVIMPACGTQQRPGSRCCQRRSWRACRPAR
jgi:hypothetical protein